MSTSIERKAYPRFGEKQQFHKDWLKSNFSINDEEIVIVQRRSSPEEHVLAMAIQLKVFQHLGYFIDIEHVPGAIIKTIRDSLNLSNVKVVYNNHRTKYRHRDYIRSKLRVTKWKDVPADQAKNTQRLAIESAHAVAKIMNNPADIINATVEYLKSNNFELPAFSTMDRLVRHIRHAVNSKIFSNVYLKSKLYGLTNRIDNLLNVAPNQVRSNFNALQSLPKKSTISNLRDLMQHHNWLLSFGGTTNLVNGIPDVKLTQFSEYIASLDSSDVKEFVPVKRYALVTILINHAQRQIKDALASTFCKMIFKMHADA